MGVYKKEKPRADSPPCATTTVVNASPAFDFVSTLAKELSDGTLELPAMPDIAERVGRALEDDDVSSGQLERIVGAEPVLAGRIVQIANSAALNFSGRRVGDLRTAISRIGVTMVRTTSMAYALSQLRHSSALEGIEKEVTSWWNRSTLVAAMSRVVAVRISQVSPDRAMLAGLLHGVGELYILTRMNRHPELFATEGALAEIVRDWHSGIASAILENWQLDEEVVRAVAEFQNYVRESRGGVDLTDVLTVGYLVASYRNHPESMELNMSDVRICRKLNLERRDYETLIESSREQVSALREALDY